MIAAANALSGASDFWAAFLDVWARGVLGTSVGALVLAGLAVAAGFVFRGLVVAALIGVLSRLAQRSKNRFDDALVAALAQPARMIPILLGLYIAVGLLNLPEEADVVAQNLLSSAVAATVFWMLLRLVDPLFTTSARLRRALTPTVLDWTKNGVKGFIAFVGVAAILEEWGIQVGPILAGLGIFGAAVALGAQDLFKNLLGGIAILLEKRFADGDWILVDGVVEGTVEKIGFRSTHVRRFDKSPVYVPNAYLSDNAVTNFSRMTHRRIKWAIGVEYGTSVTQLRAIRDGIQSYIEGNPDFASSDEVTWFIRVDSFNDSSIDFLLYCFTKTTVWTEWLAIKEALALAIKRIVEEAGTGFAFPSRTIYMAPGDTPAEPFTPPKKTPPKKPRAKPAPAAGGAPSASD